MQRLTGTFGEGDKGGDSWHRIELPDRDSTYDPYSDKQASPPTSPELLSPGLESVFKEEAFTEKETYPDPSPEYDAGRHAGPLREKKKKLYWIIAAVGFLVVALAVGLGVGLGVGLKKSNNSTSSSGKAAIPRDYASTIGAFNGSGIALASESFDSSDHGNIVMYFQHHTGEIRQAQLDTNGIWRGGDVTNIVAADAKNGTPIAAVAYARNDTAQWHIFYISADNLIKEVTNSNITNVWTAGPINNLNLHAMDDPNVGLEACWYGSFYSDVAYKHSPVPGQGPSTGNSSDQTVGIHLWYAMNPTAFNSVGWTYGDEVWSEQQVFNGYNGHAGVGCYSWGPTSDTYVFFINLDDQLNILWKDLNTTKAGNTTHPINTWTKSDISIPVFANSSMGYTNFLYAQNPDLTIGGFNVSWAAESTTIPDDGTFVINGAKGLPGTHLSVTSLPDASGGNSLLAFYQTNGTDVTEFVRDFEAGQWTSSSVPIPDS